MEQKILRQDMNIYTLAHATDRVNLCFALEREFNAVPTLGPPGARHAMLSLVLQLLSALYKRRLARDWPLLLLPSSSPHFSSLDTHSF